MKELGYINDKSVYEKIPRSEAVSKGMRILKTKWIDINKGNLGAPQLPHRHWKDAAIVDSMTRNSSKEDKAVMVNNVARAFSEAPICKELAVELPMEDGGGPGSEMVGLLQKSTYGTSEFPKGICYGSLQRKHFLPSAT